MAHCKRPSYHAHEELQPQSFTVWALKSQRIKIASASSEDMFFYQCFRTGLMGNSLKEWSPDRSHAMLYKEPTRDHKVSSHQDLIPST